MPSAASYATLDKENGHIITKMEEENGHIITKMEEENGRKSI
jgi:hypothetical protein